MTSFEGGHPPGRPGKLLPPKSNFRTDRNSRTMNEPTLSSAGVPQRGTGQRVLVAMSGGVDSSVAAALLLDAGHDVAGVTMKLWGGPSDTGCCSVSDVDDARWVADSLGIDHHVFNFGDDFERHVVDPYLNDHAAGRTPNPCVECNRHLKFSRLLRRADALGFEMIATGHHAQIAATPHGLAVARGADQSKDQSYVLHMLTDAVLERLLLPVGRMDKRTVRARAAARGLLTAAKPDSQDVCFITASSGRKAFLGDRIPLRQAKVVDTDGAEVGSVAALELVTVGQKRGIQLRDSSQPRFVLDVDAETATVTVGTRSELDCLSTPLEDWRWATADTDKRFEFQSSAHGETHWGGVSTDQRTILWDEPRRMVAPGQSVVAYDGDVVVGGGTAGRPMAQGRTARLSPG